MTDIHIRKDGHAGRITLNRPAALNALTHDMCLALEDALWTWRSDPTVKLILIDAAGDKAFCAGGDIAEIYATGTQGDYAYGQRFWRDEYRMNALIAEYPKPVVSFLKGYTMGGGVGIGCHGAHRIVGESSRIAMPECGIGLIPDVGGSFLLAHAPGHMGAYLGLTTDRMAPADAILAGFADVFVPETAWEGIKAAICADGDVSAVRAASKPTPEARLAALQPEIDRLFAARALNDVVATLRADGGSFATEALERMSRNSPLSLACTLEVLHRLKDGPRDMRAALDLEYRFASRSMEHGDLLEGIRAAIIDKDKSPRWTHDLDAVPEADVARMLAPVTGAPLSFERRSRT